MLSNDFEHFLQGPITNEEVCNKQPLENKMNSQTWSRNRYEVVFHLKVFWFCKDNPTEHNKREKKKR